MFTLYRRHHNKCPHIQRGWGYTLCNCTIWAYGAAADGSRVRKSLGTTDWSKAQEIIASGSRPAPGPTIESIDEYAARESVRAIEAWRSEPWPFVYFIDNGRAVKIGVAVDVGHRLSQLQGANPDELKLRRVVRGATDLEACLHATLSAYRIRGEWFRLNSTIEAIIVRAEPFCCIPTLFPEEQQTELTIDPTPFLQFKGARQ